MPAASPTARSIDPRALIGAAVVTAVFVGVAGAATEVPLLYVPPFAAVAYLVVADPASERPPWGPPVALTLGAVVGRVALAAATTLSGTPVPAPAATALAAGATVGVTGGALWRIELHLPPAFATGLLVLVFDVPPDRYVLAVGAGSVVLIALAYGWRTLRWSTAGP